MVLTQITIRGKQVKLLDAENVPYTFRIPYPLASSSIDLTDSTDLTNDTPNDTPFVYTIETRVAVIGYAVLGRANRRAVEDTAELLLQQYVYRSPVPAFKQKFPDTYAYGIFFSLGKFSNTLYLSVYLVDTVDDYYTLKDYLKDVVYEWHTYYNEEASVDEHNSP